MLVLQRIVLWASDVYAAGRRGAEEKFAVHRTIGKPCVVSCAQLAGFPLFEVADVGER
jgi:hypothetical protein